MAGLLVLKVSNPRHAKLAIGSAATLAVFLLETHLERKANASSSPVSDKGAAA